MIVNNFSYSTNKNLHNLTDKSVQNRNIRKLLCSVYQQVLFHTNLLPTFTFERWQKPI